MHDGVRRWFRLRPDSPASVAEQVEEEIALHVELRVRHLVARGVAPALARAEAERRFGSLERARLVLSRAATERERGMRVREWLAGWAQDFRYSARSLSRDRTVAAVIILTLALGLGASTIMFGIVDHLLLRGPAHVIDAEQVQRVYITQDQRGRGVTTLASTGYVGYTTLRDGTKSFEGIAAYRMVDERLGRGAAAREVPVAWTTASIFEVLGVEPLRGRFFTDGEAAPGSSARVAVLDYGFWHAEYGGAQDVLGRAVSIDDADYTIIGIAPPGFTGPELRPVHLWLPVSAAAPIHPEWATTWDARWLNVVARRRAGVTAEAAAAEATTVFRAAATGHHQAAAQAQLSLRPLRYGSSGEERAEAAVSRWLLGVAIVVLLIAAANVVNLLLARAIRRRREVTIRLALGISRGRLTRLLLSEGILLALFGLVAALAIAWWGGQAVRTLLLPEIQWSVPLGARTLIFAVTAALASGIVTGLAPALQSRDLSLSVGTGTRDAGRRRGRGRAVLTTVQAAFSLLLLVGAGLFMRSLWNVSRLDLGIDAARVLAVWAELDEPANALDAPDLASAPDRRDAFLRQAVQTLNAHPDVERASLAIGTPLQGSMGVELHVPGWDSIPALAGGGPFVTAAAPGYFETVGTRIVRGRGFEDGDGAGAEAIVIVNQTMAHTLWPGEDALTKCVIVGSPANPCARIVGIAENARRRGIREDPSMQYYIPLGQERGIGGTQLLVRPRGAAAGYVPELRRVLHSMDASLVYVRVNPLQRTLDMEMRPWKLGATMFLIFGTLALLIAAVGLYSVIGYGVAQRRMEIGVRMALGARTASIVGMVLRQGVGLVVIGVIIGGVIALATGPLLEPLLFETAGRDGAVVTAVAAVLCAVAVMASLVPALRAGRTDPLQALRSD